MCFFRHLSDSWPSWSSIRILTAQCEAREGLAHGRLSKAPALNVYKVTLRFSCDPLDCLPCTRESTASNNSNLGFWIVVSWLSHEQMRSW